MATLSTATPAAPAALAGFEAKRKSESADEGLHARSLGFSYAAGTARFEVFRGLTLDVPRGRTLGVFGPNGTGKTTLLRALARLQPAEGEIRSGTRSIGYVPQAYARSFYPWASLETNILLHLPNPLVNVRRNRQAIGDAHDALGLNLDLRRRPPQCSGGMLQQAALVRALARRPDLLIADEPFCALDFEVATRVRQGFVRAVRQLDMCAVLVLHDLNDILEVCDPVLAIPGRPYSTDPTLDGYALAHVFENHARGARTCSEELGVLERPESPFVAAVRKALEAGPS